MIFLIHWFYSTIFIKFAVVAKLANPNPGRDDPKENKENNKAAILQSLRTKMNNLLQEDGKFLICLIH